MNIFCGQQFKTIINNEKDDFKASRPSCPSRPSRTMDDEL